MKHKAIGSVDEDSYGPTRECYYLVQWGDDDDHMTEDEAVEAAKEYIDANFYHTSCFHTHDCCGHWYWSHGVVIGSVLDDSFIVRHDGAMNV